MGTAEKQNPMSIANNTDAKDTKTDEKDDFTVDKKDGPANLVIDAIETKEFIDDKPVPQSFEEDASPVKIQSPKRIESPVDTHRNTESKINNYVSEIYDEVEVEVQIDTAKVEANLVDSRVEEEKQNAEEAHDQV